jgi:hypothetical protein
MASRSRLYNAHGPVADHLVDDMIDAYDRWLEEAARVRESYSCWSTASRRDAATAFGAYASALDREQAAAARYREVTARLRDAGLELKAVRNAARAA